MRNAWAIIGIWFALSVVIGIVAGNVIDRMGPHDD